MAQVATVSTVDNLFTYHPKTFSINAVSTRVGELVTELQEAVEFIKSASAFTYSTRIRIALEVHGDDREFALLKGLLEFHRRKTFLFSYDRSRRVVEADVHEHDFQALKDFLSKTGQLLQKEKAFKTALKSALAFESKYRAELAQVYAPITGGAS